MARRSKSKHRREPQKDPLEALRPLIVLGLLGMILYGAYSIIQKGPKETDQAWQNSESSSAAVSEAPPFVPSVPTPPSVDLQSPSEALGSIPNQQANTSPAPLTSQSSAQEQPRALPSEQMPPTYIEAVAAIPPQSQAPQAETGSITKDTSTQTASAAFTAAWTDAHNKLEAGRYAEALAVLSVWHDDSSLSVEEKPSTRKTSWTTRGYRHLFDARHVTTTAYCGCWRNTGNNSEAIKYSLGTSFQDKRFRI